MEILYYSLRGLFQTWILSGRVKWGSQGVAALSTGYYTTRLKCGVCGYVGNVIPDKSKRTAISPALMHSRSIIVSLIYIATLMY